MKHPFFPGPVGGFKKSIAWRAIVWVVLIAFLTSCGIIPTELASMEEVFPRENPDYSDAPSRNTRSGTFEAPFEDTWQSAKTAVSQLLFFLKEKDAERGFLWATENNKMGSKDAKLYYLIHVKETGPESTTVTIVSKAQAQCSRDYGMVIIMVMCVICIPFIPWHLVKASECVEMSVPHYGTKIWNTDLSGTVNMERYLTFTRNNLIAAGY